MFVANIGAMTIPLARIVGPHGKVISFEPYRLLYQMCITNVMINGHNNVHVYNNGAGDKRSTAFLEKLDFSGSVYLDAHGNVKKQENFGGAGIWTPEAIQNGTFDRFKQRINPNTRLSETGEMAEVITIDSLELTALHFMKVDVQGSKKNSPFIFFLFGFCSFFFFFFFAAAKC